MADRGARCLLPLLLLLAATPGGSGAALNSSWWPCQQVAPQRDVQLQQVLGEWYLVEDISQIGSNAHYNMCVSMNLEQRAAGAELVMVGKEKPLGGQANYQNNTVLLSDRAGQQGLWEIPGKPSATNRTSGWWPPWCTCRETFSRWHTATPSCCSRGPRCSPASPTSRPSRCTPSTEP
ncbi:uncharacterized protein LOC134530836 isoform X2 [Bacillus rossius redtenbacheri]|uniref:uncharacterized protein LOC134530836 isoform X2 n=1 Tax=Bacillus rossius redtenbacheri TaxID=93214 RepID=UPI002FDC7E26